MSIPKPERVADMVRTIEQINLRKLREDLIAAVRRERACGTNLADGYANGAGVKGTTEHGDPTGNAVLSRKEHRQDRLRECTHTAADNLARAVEALTACESALHAISHVVSNQPITPTGCDLCTAAGLKDRTWEHKGSVSGRLDRDMYLCTAHYQYVHRTGEAPSEAQTRHWDMTGSWRIRETA